MVTVKRTGILLGLILGAVVVTACVNAVIKPPDEVFSDYVAQEKIKLTVGLNITEELRQEKSKTDYFVIPIGSWVAANSISLAKHVFTSAVAIEKNSTASNLKVDAILTPRIAFINRTRGATSFGDSIITVKVEWDLRGPSGNPIWIETVGGEASGSTGWTKPEVVLEKALNNLLKNSQTAFRSSRAIARFASTR